MKIIKEPEVYLMGVQTIVPSELERFLKNHGIDTWTTDAPSDSEKLIEIAGRLCYMSFAKPRPGGNAAYIEHILEVGHGSVLEHGVFNFIITNISRTCSHELVRHRAGFGYSQLSQRYVDESVAEYIEPECIRDDPDLHHIWVATIDQAHEAYKRLANKLAVQLRWDPKYRCKVCSGHGYNASDPLKDQIVCTDCKGQGVDPSKKTDLRKAARQAARSVLPNATETKISVTANFRAIRHFIELRASRFAEPEIRMVALAMLGIMKVWAPNTFKDYEVVQVEPGVYEAQTKSRKV